MRKQLLISFFMLVSLTLPKTANAYDFMVDGIAYNVNYNYVLNRYEVEVTYEVEPIDWYYTEDGFPLAIDTRPAYGDAGFNSDWSPKEIVIPETVRSYYLGSERDFVVTRIGDYAFYSCEGLTGSLTIPNTVTSIGIGAFENCSGYVGDGILTIPNSVEEINGGSETFWSCSFSSIVSLIEYPENGMYWGIESLDSNTPLYVPYGTIDKYQSCDPWYRFTNIQELEKPEQKPGDIDGSGIVDIDDVNAIINIILENSLPSNFAGDPDVDGSGIVDVDDVNEVINYILTH